MVLQRFLPSRKFHRIAKFVFVLVLLACSVWYYVFAFNKNSGKGSKRPRAPNLVMGNLNVHIWREVCGYELSDLRRSLFFPQFPDESFKRSITELQFEDDRVDYGQRIFGFLQPQHNGSYSFAIASDDTSELWLSLNEDFNAKQLIAEVVEKGASGWTEKNQLNKYPDQISKDVKLYEGRRYYIEVVHKQGAGRGFVQVYWKTDKNRVFKLIKGEYLSQYTTDIDMFAAKEDVLHHVFSGRHSLIFDQKYKTISSEYLKFYSLPFIPKEYYLADCDYNTSWVISGKVYRYGGLQFAHESSVYPGDDTAMGEWEISSPNRLADPSVIQAVANDLTNSLRLKTSK